MGDFSLWVESCQSAHRQRPSDLGRSPDDQSWSEAARPVQAIASVKRTFAYPKTDGSGYGQRDRGNHGQKPVFNDGQRGGFLNGRMVATIWQAYSLHDRGSGRMSWVNGLISAWGLPQAEQHRLRRRVLGDTLGLVVLVMAGLLPKSAACAEIFVGPPGRTVYINGEIQSGDATTFQRSIDSELAVFHKKYPNASLVMIVRPTSLGGSVQEAMEIGRAVRKNALWVNTNAPGQRCASACVLILAAGVMKLPGAGSIGIHRPTFPSNSFSTLTSQQALEQYKAMSEEVRLYLAEMDIPPILFDEMMQIKSDEIKWLTWDQLSTYGLVGQTAAYAEWRHARAVENRKRLVERFGEAIVRRHESAQEAATRFVIKCMDQRGVEFGEACDAEANRRFPDPIRSQDLQ
jgi:hypothetical protein